MKINNALLEDKQDKLVSGNNIKTVLGQSLLGSGNIQFLRHNFINSGYTTSGSYDYTGCKFTLTEPTIVEVVLHYSNAAAMEIGLKDATNTEAWPCDFGKTVSSKSEGSGALSYSRMLDAGTYYVWAKSAFGGSSNTISVNKYVFIIQ